MENNENQKQQAIATHSQQAGEFAASYEDMEQDAYSSCFTYSRHRLDAWLNRFLPASGNGLRVLDLGCGTGRYMATLRERGFDVVGVDGSEEMLEEARINNPDSDLRLSDVDHLPFEDGEFDIVLSIEVLRYLPKLDNCLSEAQRVLKPGGLCLMTAAPLWSWNGYPLVNRAATLAPLGSLVRLKQFFTSARNARRAFRRAGFRALEVHGVYCGPLNWLEHLAPSRLPQLLRQWESLDNKIADHPAWREYSNMFLIKARKN